jgi:hypothetical protein
VELRVGGDGVSVALELSGGDHLKADQLSIANVTASSGGEPIRTAHEMPTTSPRKFATRPYSLLNCSFSVPVDGRHAPEGADPLAPDWAGWRRRASVLASSPWPILSAANATMCARVSSRPGSSWT